jgi:cytochrome c oxidase subunit II
MDDRVMSLRAPAVRRLVGPAFAAVLVASLAGCNAAQFPQSTLNPLGDFARMVDGLFMTTVWWALLVFVLVEGALVWAIFRFRGRPGDPEPVQTHGNTTVEIIWTVIPALILAMIAVPTVRTIFRTYETPKGDALQVEVVGHQWWWEFRYPQYGITTANELHIPVGRTVALKMGSGDVLHSFWVPQFAAKRDVFPNRSTVLWFKAEKDGHYSGQCAEFCGIQHGRMAFHVAAETPEQFERYVAARKAGVVPVSAPAADSTRADSAVPARAAQAPTPVATASLAATAPAAGPADSLVQAGEKLFTTKACAGCHSLNASKPMGVGPNLSGIGTRKYIAAGVLENTDENLSRWIQNAQAIKVGVLMPNLGVKEAEAKALVAYLRTQR